MSNESDEGVDPFSSQEILNSKFVGSFSRTPPNDPHIKNVTYLPDGTPFASMFSDRSEHDDHAKGHSQVIRLQKAIVKDNFVKLSKGDTPCLQSLLTFVKPFIRGNPKIKSCWRHLAKKCPDIDPFQDF